MACCAPCYVGLAGWCCVWACARCLCSHSTRDSSSWQEATSEEADDILRACRLGAGAYAKTEEEAIALTQGAAKPGWVVALVPHNSEGKCPAHILYVDEEREDVVLAIRGLEMGDNQDWQIITTTGGGKNTYDGELVHQGMARAARYLLETQIPKIRSILKERRGYTFTIVGHSLGAGVGSLLAILLADNLSFVGGLPRHYLRCFAIALPRVTSLELSVRQADIIWAVVLQDDFLPRVDTSDIFAIFPLARSTNCFCRYTCTCACYAACRACCYDHCPCLHSNQWELYPPGRLYHIIYKAAACGHRVPPMLRTAIPLTNRFERTRYSSTTFADHYLNKYLEVLNSMLLDGSIEAGRPAAPLPQRMVRNEEREQEYEAAVKELERFAKQEATGKKPVALESELATAESELVHIGSEKGEWGGKAGEVGRVRMAAATREDRSGGHEGGCGTGMGEPIEGLRTGEGAEGARMVEVAGTGEGPSAGALTVEGNGVVGGKQVVAVGDRRDLEKAGVGAERGASAGGGGGAGVRVEGEGLAEMGEGGSSSKPSDGVGGAVGIENDAANGQRSEGGQVEPGLAMPAETNGDEAQRW